MSPFSPAPEFNFQEEIGSAAEFPFVGQDGGSAAYKKRALAAAMGAELAQCPAAYRAAAGQYRYRARPGPELAGLGQSGNGSAMKWTLLGLGAALFFMWWGSRK